MPCTRWVSRPGVQAAKKTAPYSWNAIMLADGVSAEFTASRTTVSGQCSGDEAHAEIGGYPSVRRFRDAGAAPNVGRIGRYRGPLPREFLRTLHISFSNACASLTWGYLRARPESRIVKIARGCVCKTCLVRSTWSVASRMDAVSTDLQNSYHVHWYVH